MGKRELLIVIAFVVLGIGVYEVTAPPAKPGEGFSFARFWTNARRGVQRDRVQASATLKGTIATPARVTEVRIANVTQFVRVIGEARADVAYELTVDSTGPDDATAQESARKAVLKQDDLGAVISLRAAYPPQSRSLSRLVLRVPSRLTVRVDGARGVDMANVSGAHLEAVVGDVTLRTISGAVTGSHRDGNLTVSHAATVNLTIVNSTGTFDAIASRLTLIARSSHCRIGTSEGAVEVDETSTDVSITGQAGTIRVSGSGGRVTIDQPRADTTVDVRRAEVEVSMSKAVALTLVTTDDSLRLLFVEPPAVTVDAVTTEAGRIQAGDFALTADASGSPGASEEARLSHAFGAPGAPRVVLRNQRADIVIRKAK